MELTEFLMDRQFTKRREEIEELIPAKTILIDGKEVYLYNYTIDAMKNTFIEDSIVITQQPFSSEIPVHVHEFIELTYVFKGKCNTVINNKIIPLTEGTLVMIDKNTPHTVEATSKDDIVLSITLKKDYLSPSFLSRLSSSSIISIFLVDLLMESRESNRYLLFNSGKKEKIIEVVNNIVWEYFHKRIYSDEIINSYLVILFSELIREDEISQRHTHIPNSNNYTLIDFLQYIEENYQDCTLTSMAKHFNFHPNYLSNLLKKGTGKSFKDLLQLQKISKAGLMLVNSNLPIPEIADQVGYSSVTFFYKKFKQIFDMTPSDYRKQHSWDKGSG
ncbi:AraC family transcriptional regulator [Metabacillus litoralis]|uniref:AraC family transcriptional regulator n=1 Tax=Metabacillus litoralis TaxID=152268 RepID=UPI001BA630E6|nr:AraC family transcriptional regulator [Metabacillus litoralis]MCM3164244.1 AraC family transcriptional regulator [Metabacillus litoralis]